MIDDSVKRVLFVAGWNTDDNDYCEEQALLRKCYPNAVVERFYWNSTLSWEDSLAEADGNAYRELQILLKEIPTKERQKTVLIGHSLGARIAVNAIMNGRQIVGGLVLMGAAIDGDSTSVERAAKYVTTQVVNLYAPSDIVLKFYSIVQGCNAFGQQETDGDYTNDIYVEMNFISKALLSMFRAETLLPLLIPSCGVPRLLKTVPQMVSAFNALKNYTVMSHCFYDYIEAWYEY